MFVPPAKSLAEIPLSPASWAMNAEHSRGRRFPEPEHRYRSEYARDRDRIIHSRAFRRLEAKTQVFTTRYSDHFRNRLTHTIEVSQIARTVAHALGANTEHESALEQREVAGHEELLPGAAETNPDDVRFELGDGCDELIVFG